MRWKGRTPAKQAASGAVPSQDRNLGRCGGFSLRQNLGGKVNGRTEKACVTIIAVASASLVACAQKPVEAARMLGSDPQVGLALIKRQGCGACHDIPGVAWPRGEVGGRLAGFADRTLIAGRLPNRPDALVRWLRDPPALTPDIAMPSTGLSETQARDVAAYLYTLDDD